MATLTLNLTKNGTKIATDHEGEAAVLNAYDTLKIVLHAGWGPTDQITRVDFYTTEAAKNQALPSPIHWSLADIAGLQGAFTITPHPAGGPVHTLDVMETQVPPLPKGEIDWWYKVSVTNVDPLDPELINKGGGGARWVRISSATAPYIETVSRETEPAHR